MKGKFHTEEAVIPILQRKGIMVVEHDYDENNNLIVVKRIGIPANVHPGLRILGKLDFMRRKGWAVVKTEQLYEARVKKGQKKKEEGEGTPKKELKRKRTFSKQKN